MRRLLFSLFFFYLTISVSLAQDFILNGRVFSGDDNQSLRGVTVRLIGSQISTQSDDDGRFSIPVPGEGARLSFSFIGFKSKEISVGKSRFVEVELFPESTRLEEVVIGYGNVSKENYIGSATVITNSVWENRPLSSFEKALQGVAPGVQVSNLSGQPGSSTLVRIRGVGSFAASSTPLYVLDGVAITNGNMSYMNQFLDNSNSADVLSSLNPNDIAEMRISKDAADAAIYGSRAANGVIFITTKKGRNGRTRFTANLSGGYSSPAVEKHDVLGSSEYYKLFRDAYFADRLSAGFSPAVAAFKADSLTVAGFKYNPYNVVNPYNADGQLSDNARLLSNTNWRDEVLRTGITRNADISASGGSDKTRFYVSGAYFNQDGIVIGSDFSRYSGRFNISSRVNNYLSFGVNNNLSYTDQNTPPGALAGSNPVRFADLAANIYPVYALDGNGQPILDATGKKVYNYTNAVAQDFNPLGLAELDEFNTRTARVISNPYAELRFLKNFKARSAIGVDYIANRERQFYNSLHGNGVGVSGRGYRFSREDITLTFINTLNYEANLGRHYINMLAGQEAFKSRRDNTYSQATNFAFPGTDELISASTPTIARSFVTEQRFESYFSRVSYNYANTYYLTGSFRRDGSSVFGPGNRFGNFYSVGAAWRIGREYFLRNASFLDELKLRASYGVSGNDRLGTDNNRNLEMRYAAQGLYNLGRNYEGQAGMVYSQLANDDLKWEKNAMLDIGLEFALFKNRLSGEFAYYDRGSDGLLFARPISLTTGFETVASNLASMSNRGFEMLLNATVLNNSRFRWNTSFNLSFNKNKIHGMTTDEVIERNTFKRWKVGTDRYRWYMREYAGVDQQSGKPLWYANELDTDGRPTGNRITTSNWSLADQYDLGSSLPTFTGGFNNTLRFKDFDLSAYTYFSGGNKIYDNLYMTLMHGGASPGQQLSSDILSAWQKPGDLSSVPRFLPRNTDLANNTSSRFLFDGTYLRVKNITLGYTLRDDFLKAAQLQQIRVYLMAENPFTLARHKGMDPEVDNSGLSTFDIPGVKTFSAGISLGF